MKTRKNKNKIKNKSLRKNKIKNKMKNKSLRKNKNKIKNKSLRKTTQKGGFFLNTDEIHSKTPEGYNVFNYDQFINDEKVMNYDANTDYGSSFNNPTKIMGNIQTKFQISPIISLSINNPIDYLRIYNTHCLNQMQILSYLNLIKSIISINQTINYFLLWGYLFIFYYIAQQSSIVLNLCRKISNSLSYEKICNDPDYILIKRIFENCNQNIRENFEKGLEGTIWKFFIGVKTSTTISNIHSTIKGYQFLYAYYLKNKYYVITPDDLINKFKNYNCFQKYKIIEFTDTSSGGRGEGGEASSIGKSFSSFISKLSTKSNNSGGGGGGGTSSIDTSSEGRGGGEVVSPIDTSSGGGEGEASSNPKSLFSSVIGKFTAIKSNNSGGGGGGGGGVGGGVGGNGEILIPFKKNETLFFKLNIDECLELSAQISINPYFIKKFENVSLIVNDNDIIGEIPKQYYSWDFTYSVKNSYDDICNALNNLMSKEDSKTYFAEYLYGRFIRSLEDIDILFYTGESESNVAGAIPEQKKFVVLDENQSFQDRGINNKTSSSIDTIVYKLAMKHIYILLSFTNYFKYNVINIDEIINDDAKVEKFKTEWYKLNQKEISLETFCQEIFNIFEINLDQKNMYACFIFVFTLFRILIYVESYFAIIENARIKDAHCEDLLYSNGIINNVHEIFYYDEDNMNNLVKIVNKFLTKETKDVITECKFIIQESTEANTFPPAHKISFQQATKIVKRDNKIYFYIFNGCTRFLNSHGDIIGLIFSLTILEINILDSKPEKTNDLLSISNLISRELTCEHKFLFIWNNKDRTIRENILYNLNAQKASNNSNDSSCFDSECLLNIFNLNRERKERDLKLAMAPRQIGTRKIESAYGEEGEKGEVVDILSYGRKGVW